MFLVVNTLATPATATLPPAAPLKPIRLTSCRFCAPRRIPPAPLISAPVPMWLLVLLWLETTALDTPTPTLPASDAAAASEVAPVSLRLVSATSPVVTTLAPLPIAASVVSVNTLTAKAPATETLSPAAPETASV